MRRLPIVCPQTYEGMTMVVVKCTRCENWQSSSGQCLVYMGCEHLPLVASDEVPPCHLETRCQHQLQTLPAPCHVRARGLVCESALADAGHPDPSNSEIGFHAMMVAGPDELEER